MTFIAIFVVGEGFDDGPIRNYSPAKALLSRKPWWS